jgi:hypothetical protein
MTNLDSNNGGISVKNRNVASINQSIQNKNLKDRHSGVDDDFTNESNLASKKGTAFMSKLKPSKSDINSVVPVVDK